ncbi:hypothetical protein M231_03290 [Tremella mesenterica]|uniref:Uncharacterized protein n=1 Tax=Tremella mesenterica TaxID=5217 RepID=A0A4V1M482_TREME|nr:hypothetical protein M231_03290 [Tremella mesenterica]
MSYLVEPTSEASGSESPPHSYAPLTELLIRSPSMIYSPVPEDSRDPTATSQTPYLTNVQRRSRPDHNSSSDFRAIDLAVAYRVASVSSSGPTSQLSPGFSLNNLMTCIECDTLIGTLEDPVTPGQMEYLVEFFQAEADDLMLLCPQHGHAQLAPAESDVCAYCGEQPILLFTNVSGEDGNDGGGWRTRYTAERKGFEALRPGTIRNLSRGDLWRLEGRDADINTKYGPQSFDWNGKHQGEVLRSAD